MHLMGLRGCDESYGGSFVRDESIEIEQPPASHRNRARPLRTERTTPLVPFRTSLWAQERMKDVPHFRVIITLAQSLGVSESSSNIQK